MVFGRRFILAVLVFVLFFFNLSPVWGYEEATVASGGTIAVKVVLKGAPPPVRIFHLIFSPNIDFCGKISDGKGNCLLKEFQVSQDGGFQNVVIAVVVLQPHHLVSPSIELKVP